MTETRFLIDNQNKHVKCRAYVEYLLDYIKRHFPVQDSVLRMKPKGKRRYVLFVDKDNANNTVLNVKYSTESKQWACADSKEPFLLKLLENLELDTGFLVFRCNITFKT